MEKRAVWPIVVLSNLAIFKAQVIIQFTWEGSLFLITIFSYLMVKVGKDTIPGKVPKLCPRRHMNLDPGLEIGASYLGDFKFGPDGVYGLTIPNDMGRVFSMLATSWANLVIEGKPYLQSFK